AGANGGARSRPLGRLPGVEQMSDGVWLLEMAGVTGAGDDLDTRVGDAAGHLPRDLHVLRVELAHDEQHRHPALAQPLPVRRLHALPERAQLVGEPLDGVGGAPLVDARTITGQRREEWLREPPFEERIDAVALHLLRETLVGLAARGALGGVRDA